MGEVVDERKIKTGTETSPPPINATPLAEETKTIDDGTKTFTLRKTISAHSEVALKQLKLREPTAKDIVRAGYPVLLRPSGPSGVQIVVEEEKMAMMICLLAAIPPSSVDQLHPRDWATISTWLTSFFVPDWEQLQTT